MSHETSLIATLALSLIAALIGEFSFILAGLGLLCACCPPRGST